MRDIEIGPTQVRLGSCVTSAAGVTCDAQLYGDEGGPFEFGDQEPISSHRKLLRAKAVVVSVAEAVSRKRGERERRIG